MSPARFYRATQLFERWKFYLEIFFIRGLVSIMTRYLVRG